MATQLSFIDKNGHETYRVKMSEDIAEAIDGYCKSKYYDELLAPSSRGFIERNLPRLPRNLVYRFSAQDAIWYSDIVSIRYSVEPT